MSEPLIRLVRPNDMNKLQTLDLKCYPYPLPLSEWQEKLKGSGKEDEARIVICEVFNTAAGFAMWTIDKEHDGSHLVRLGVVPKFRRNGIGTLLVDACVRDTRKYGCEFIRTIVPHIHCCPGDSDDVSVFLTHSNFSPATKHGVQHGYREMYGKRVDGYVFERKIDVFAP